MLLTHTYHPVSYCTIEYHWYESYGDEVTKHFRQEVGGHSIVATDILMTKIEKKQVDVEV